MQLLDYFSRTYVVNLPARTDRRREMLQMLRKLGLRPSPGRLEFFVAIRPDAAGTFPNVGVRGCFMSHLTLLREAIALGAQRVLVMEDDLEISRTLPALQAKLVEVLSSTPWGLVYLGHVAKHVPTAENGLVAWDGETDCSHFYGVQEPTLSQLVRYLEAVLERPQGHPDGGAMDYDGALQMFREQTGTVTLFATPNLGWQRSSRSDISGGRWFDRNPLTRGPVAKLRKVKNLLRPAP